MKILVSSILLILLAVPGFAQDDAFERVLTIKDFKGLNTKASAFSIQPNEFIRAHDVDFGRNLSSITKRYGYNLYGSVGGADSIVGMYGVPFPDGTQRLFIVTDTVDEGYGCVWVTPEDNALSFVHTDSISFQMTTAENNTMMVILGADTASKLYTAGEGLTETIDSLASLCTDSLSGLTGAAATASATFGGCGDAATDSSCLVIYITYTLAEGGVPATAEIVGHGKGTGVNACVQWRHYSALNSWDLVTTQFSIQEKPTFEVHNSSVYIANGRQGGGIWDAVNGYTTYPPRAPGAVETIPLHHTIKNLNGKYYYTVAAYVFKGADSFLYQPGPIVGPVIVDSGAVLLTGLMQAAQDSLTESYDSLAFMVFRTKTDHKLRDTTVFWSLSGDTEYEFRWADSAGAPLLSGLTFTDTLHDSDLVSPTFWNDANRSIYGRDSTGALTRRYGSPGYDSTYADNAMDTSAYSIATDTAGRYGIFYGVLSQTDTLGVVYVSTFMDTINGIESDTSRSIKVWNNNGVPRYGNRIELPPTPDNDSGLVRNLYRAHLQLVKTDSLYWFDEEDLIRPDTLRLLDPETIKYLIKLGYWRYFDKPTWRKMSVFDTVLTDWFYLVAQLPTDSAAYTDSIRYDILQRMPIFNRRTPPANMNNLLVFDGRLFGTSGNKYWYSNLFNGADSLWQWGQMDFLRVNPGDGEEIMGGFPARTNLRLLKGTSNYVIPLPQSGGFGRAQLAGNFGCISQRSLAHGFGGHYYLTNYGVVRETEGLLLENTYQIDTISGVLDNFDKLSLSTKRDAVGFYNDQKYMLSIPSLDTTYVYDEPSKTWVTWGFTFGGATMYGVDLNAQLAPLDTMYFFKQGGLGIYRYGTSEYDNGVAVSPQWRTGPILAAPNEKQITKIGLWVNSDDYTTDRFFVVPYNEMGTPLDSIYYTTLNSKRYHLKGVDPNSALYFTIEGRVVFNATLDNTVIDALDIFWKPISGQTMQY